MRKEREIKEGHVIKIIQVRTQNRIILPADVMHVLNIKEGDHLAFIKEKPGVRVVKAMLDINSQRG